MSSRQRTVYEFLEWSEEVQAAIIKLCQEQKIHKVRIIEGEKVLTVEDVQKGEVIAEVSKELQIPSMPYMPSERFKVEKPSPLEPLEHIPFLRIPKAIITWINIPIIPQVKILFYPEFTITPLALESRKSFACSRSTALPRVLMKASSSKCPSKRNPVV